MKNKHNRVFHLLQIIFLFLVVTSCSTTKYVPEGKYLLDKIFFEMDSNRVEESELLPFVKQIPNDPKLGLMIYNMVGDDSNWFKRMIQKIGEPPVIYNQTLTNQSVNELSIQMKNLGYLNSSVHATIDTIGKKAYINYHIHEGNAFRVRNYMVDLSDQRINNLALGGARFTRDTTFLRPDSMRIRRDSTNRFSNIVRRNWLGRSRGPVSYIKEGIVFDMNTLEKERVRISELLRNSGYFASSLDNLHYLADTTMRAQQVDLKLILKDTIRNQIYRIGRVNVYSGYDQTDRRNYRIVDSVENKGIHIYYDNMHFLRPGVISNKVLIRPEDIFRERAGERTVNMFQSMSCVSRVNIEYKERNYADSTLLDCDIYLTPGNAHSIQAGIEGTNKAGDLGAALTVNYGHLNLFNGSEIFNIRLRGAYEFVDGDSREGMDNNYYELGITPSITFPKFHFPFFNRFIKDRYNESTRYSLGLNIQNRSLFTRNFFNFNWKVNWSNRRNTLTHSLSPLDVNFVFMPYKSAKFEEMLDQYDPLTRYSYENIFTAGVNYGLIYTNANVGGVRDNLYTIRFNIETSGNVLQGFASTFGLDKNEQGQYTVMGNPFAQYVKGDIDFSQTFRLSYNSDLAFRAGLGMALPYGNSSILPFEKRYYAGGPNSVRGWKTRYLGPGGFNQGQEGDPTTHVGDVNFILSAEYRYKVLNWLEPAFFIDCGNIWTIKNYINQLNSSFQWNSFHKELAVGTGVGLRFDLSFLIFRIDAGTKVYDPAWESENRFILFRENLWKNSAFYLAIGYPF